MMGLMKTKHLLAIILVYLVGIESGHCSEKEIKKSSNDSEVVWIKIRHGLGEDQKRPEIYIICGGQEIWCNGADAHCPDWDEPFQRAIRQIIEAPCSMKETAALLIRIFPEKPNWKMPEYGALRFTFMHKNNKETHHFLSRERSLILLEELSTYLQSTNVAPLKSFQSQFSDSAVEAIAKPRK